ncbi:MAG: thioesterase family protein [Fusobacteriaceae bacterium]|jgi:predicted thioesterase|nr:thioesterase family protein [Fusobacteriaceae bacterium]
MLKEGMTLTIEKIVGANETAKCLCSGAADVFSTPMLIAFMENASFLLAGKELADGESTVGTTVNVAHLKANAIGDKITCTATLEKLEGKKLTFNVVVKYGDEIVGEGTHGRYIINFAKFMSNIKR